MFDIEYKGGNCIVISTKSGAVVFDPKTSLVGVKDVTTKGVVEVATEDRFAVRDHGAKLVIDSPGEYEIANIAIRGVAAQRHIDAPESLPVGTIYRVAIDGVRIAVLGNIAPKLSESQLEAIGVVDILVLPVGGGGYTLDPTGATEMVRSIEPNAVIPVHYGDTSLTYEVPQEELSVFTSELGAPVESVGTKYKVKNAAALPQALQVLVIDRS